MSTLPKPFSADALLLESLLVPARRQSVWPEPTCDLDSVLERVANALPELDAAVKAPEALLSELVGLDRSRLADALDERPSLRGPVFLQHVRETALAALPLQADLAEALAFLAIQQSEASVDLEEARRHLLAAYCLLAGVRRLRRLPAEAEALLNRAAFLLGSPEDQALFFRTLAVLRWEQGRPELAHALLARTLRITRTPMAEIVRSQFLLCLLQMVEGVEIARPRATLRAVAKALDPAHDTYRALLARLGLALVAGRAGDRSAALSHRHSAQDLFSLLPGDTAALAYAGWLDARVAVLAVPEGGIEPLQSARAELLRHELPFAATLATIDAVLFLGASHQTHLIPSFLADAPLPLALPPATHLCEDLAEPPRGLLRRSWYEAHLRREASRLPVLLRRVCLLRGIPTEPLPFV